MKKIPLLSITFLGLIILGVVLSPAQTAQGSVRAASLDGLSGLAGNQLIGKNNEPVSIPGSEPSAVDVLTVTWISPVGNDEVLDVGCQTVHLAVTVQSTEPVERVRFYYWDYKKEDYILIGNDYEPPYEIDFYTCPLNPEWNQIFAKAYDIKDNESEREHIWLVKHVVYLPLVYKNYPTRLTLAKQVINNNGGTALPTDWTLSAAGPTPISGAGGVGPSVVKPGTYTLSETGGPDGYSASDWVCDGGFQNGNKITLVGGENVTCTITNDDDPGTLRVVKNLVNNDGGALTKSDFEFSVNGGLAIPFEADGQNDLVVGAGTYTVVETAVAGYLTTYNNCTNVAVPNGGLATCTITNNDIAPTLTLVKRVVNNDGGTRLANEWTLTATGAGGFSGTGTQHPVLNRATLGPNPVDANVTYTLSESGPAGYNASAWTCVGGAQVGDTITLDVGEAATCTIANNDVLPTLTLVKEVVNDNGGAHLANEWTLSATGTGGFSGTGTQDPILNKATLGPNPVNANVAYTLSESGPSGYAASAWVCVGGTQVNDQITLAFGDTATCTITNNDVGATLELVKQVVNDNGGTALATDWTLSATGPTPISGPGGVGPSPVDPGTYTLSETGPAGYTPSAWVCVGGTQVIDQITLALGEVATCTISNDDIAPTLTLVKEVVNNNGGTNQASEWTLTASGTGGFSGTGTQHPVQNRATLGPNNVIANVSYTLSETGPAGYIASAWVCTGGGTQVGNQITLGVGESATCTITNDDVSASLALVKAVVNDNGGTATPTAWNLSASGPTPISGNGGVGPSNVSPGTYTLSESAGPGGYTASAWVCTGTGTQNGNQITLDLGETASCTITNNDIPPSLTLVKNVTNDDGGTAVPNNWTLNASGPTPISGAGGATSGAGFDAGTYTLSESGGPVGYTASGWVCTGTGTQIGNQITLDLGETANCTITNNDVAPTLKLVKTVTNNDGGTLGPDDWTLSATAASPNDGRNFSNLGGSGVFETVYANAGYVLAETSVAGYAAGSWSCDGGNLVGSTVTLDPGETVVTCTINNNDVAPTLKLVKTVTNDNAGTSQPDDWMLSADASPPSHTRNFSYPGGSGDFVIVFANKGYVLSESGPEGYTASAWGCDGGVLVGSTITLAPGDIGVTCTIDNDDNAI